MYIRKAEKKDVYDCVPLIYSAGVPLFDYIYRHEQITAEHFIHKEFLSEYGYTSYNLHWVVEHQGKVIAVVACYATKDLSRMDNGTIKNILKMYKFRFPRVLMRALNSSSVVTKPSETSLHVANFGVHPNYRSQGIGTQLLQHLKMHAIEQGYSGLSLDVSKANPKGQSLYERIGFKVVEETAFKDENTQRIPNGRRMEWYF
ncbi:GNAT family N-acetyltransferase [uncultured Acinetobacter sp.]|uniref:GNAT family N-acetyltransferase n=1 Tax=uncultured Acinetobacter sp. TaxID=165433 RepID=UPI0006795BA0